MRRISIAFVLSTLLFVSVVSAQQTTTTSQPTATSTGNLANTAKSGVGIDTIVNCVGAKNGTIPIWTGSAPPNITLCNSGIYEASPYGTGAIGILNPNPVAALDVNGDINTAKTYQIGGSSVLTISSGTDDNLFVGVGAGANNVPSQGYQNVFVGYQAGYSNTTGSYNTFSGYTSGFSNIDGSEIPSPGIRPATVATAALTTRLSGLIPATTPSAGRIPSPGIVLASLIPPEPTMPSSAILLEVTTPSAATILSSVT